MSLSLLCCYEHNNIRSDKHETADEVFGLLREFNRDRGSACLIVTHDPRLAARCDRLIELVDGRLVAG